MPKVSEVCSHVRSKNAGPFWITLDLWFPDARTFAQYADARAFQAEAIATLFDVNAAMIKSFKIPDLNVIKISYPRKQAQGGILERDMHGGQQYVRLLDVAL